MGKPLKQSVLGKLGCLLCLVFLVSCTVKYKDRVEGELEDDSILDTSNEDEHYDKRDRSKGRPPTSGEGSVAMGVDGQGFFGGDVLYAKLETLRKRLVAALKEIDFGYNVPELCSVSLCKDLNNKLCKYLAHLSAAQRIQCQKDIVAGVHEVLALNEKGSATPFVITDGPLLVPGPSGVPTSVSAATKLGPEGPIQMVRRVIEESSDEENVGVMGHEFQHKILLAGMRAYFQDDDPDETFGTVRARLDAIGAGIGIYTFSLGQHHDFGGIYSWEVHDFASVKDAGSSFLNPVTSSLGCPEGYESSEELSGLDVKVDSKFVFCYRKHEIGVEEKYDFGGLYVSVMGPSSLTSNYRPMQNPLTGNNSCPPGYYDTTIARFFVVSWIPASLQLCHREHAPDRRAQLHFGGMYRLLVSPTTSEFVPTLSGGYFNPLASDRRCPPNYEPAVIHAIPQGGVLFGNTQLGYCYQRTGVE